MDGMGEETFQVYILCVPGPLVGAWSTRFSIAWSW